MMSINVDETYESSDEVELQTDYLLHSKENFWKIRNGRGVLMNGKRISGSCPNISNEDFFSPSNQPLTSWENANVISNKQPTDSDDQHICEMELMITKVKLYVLQLEAQLSELKAKKKNNVLQGTTPNTIMPLVTIHRLPQSMNSEDFKNNRKRMLSTTETSNVSNSSPNKFSLQLSPNKGDIIDNINIMPIQENESVDASKKEAHSHNSPCNRNVTIPITRCSDASLTASDATSMPCLSPFFSTSPGHYRRPNGITTRRSSTGHLSELSIVISPSDREVASSHKVSGVVSTIENINSIGNSPEHGLCEYENAYQNSNNDTPNSPLDQITNTRMEITEKTLTSKQTPVHIKKRKLLLPNDCQTRYAASPRPVLEVSDNKYNYGRKLPRTKKSENIKKLQKGPKQSPFVLLATKKNIEDKRAQTLLSLYVDDRRPIDFLSRSLSTTEESNLFKDYSSDDNDDCTYGIQKSILPKKILPVPSNSKNTADKCCYVKLVHGYKFVEGMKIYT